jgi:RHS repeat-associated protein
MYSAGSWTNQTGGMDVSLQIDKMMLYPNGYLNMNQNGEYTKHYYADALRIASKIGNGFSQNLCYEANQIGDDIDPNYLEDRRDKQYDEMMEELTELINGNQITDINPIPYPEANLCNLSGSGIETALFFYHPDHLGSTGMVTDNSSNITQGMLYAPFGEIISDYSPAFHDSPMPNYAFNAKELDEENNMYYYSARYYAPPTFISRDPMFEKYPSISPYTYCSNNPVNRIDPTGEYDYEVDLTNKKITRTGEKGSPDRLIIIKENGDRVESGEFAAGTIKGHGTRAYSKDGNYSYLRVRGDDNGTKMFNFLADNTGNEWEQIKTGIAGEKGLNFLTTSYSSEESKGGKYLYNSQLRHGYYIREWNHNHLGNSIPVPSGMPGTVQEGEGDISLATTVSANSARRGYKAPTFNVYMTGYGNSPYTPNSQVSDFEHIYNIYGKRPRMK